MDDLQNAIFSTTGLLFDDRDPRRQAIERRLAEIIEPRVEKVRQLHEKAMGPLISAVSPLESIADFLIRKEDKERGIAERLVGAVKRGGDIPGALETRGVKPSIALPLGLAAAVALPGAGEMTSLGKGTEELTTKTLRRLETEVKAPIVSKQHIVNLSRMPDLRQAERNLVTKVLNEFEGRKIRVADFVNKVKSELLPLKKGGGKLSEGRYENITLSDGLRGPITNYQEHIYQSPIKTNAGNVHFDSSDFPNYFAHTRIEDVGQRMGEPQRIGQSVGPRGEPIPLSKPTGAGETKTRRVLEIQSDLFQKGGLERELEGYTLSDAQLDVLNKNLDKASDSLIEGLELTREHLPVLRKWTKHAGIFSDNPKLASRKIKEIITELEKQEPSLKELEIARLDPYRNIWHERIIKEEIKQAAIDGKTKLQFPTGETAMKVEGLGDEHSFTTETKFNKYMDSGDESDLLLKPEELKEGMMIGRPVGLGSPGESIEDFWVVTNVVGEGRFKAASNLDVAAYLGEEASINPKRFLPDIKNELGQQGIIETFDISGKINTNNPIYRFYEKDVQKFLKRQYPYMKRITDPQGVEWFEVPILENIIKAPIEAFGLLPLLAAQQITRKE